MNSKQNMKFATDSLKEEQEAIDVYNYRIKNCDDKELIDIMKYALREEHVHHDKFQKWIKKNMKSIKIPK